MRRDSYARGPTDHTGELGNGSGGKVRSELGADSSSLAVGAGDLAPDDALALNAAVRRRADGWKSNSLVGSGLLDLVDVGNALAEVELCGSEGMIERACWLGWYVTTL
jgi:hypothetical protein